MTANAALRATLTAAEQQHVADVAAAGERRLRAVIRAIGEQPVPVDELRHIPAVVAAANVVARILAGGAPIHLTHKET
jgi:C4-dicarboxylate-specific signal transduction histidine kinase